MSTTTQTPATTDSVLREIDSRLDRLDAAEKGFRLIGDRSAEYIETTIAEERARLLRDRRSLVATDREEPNPQAKIASVSAGLKPRLHCVEFAEQRLSEWEGDIERRRDQWALRKKMEDERTTRPDSPPADPNAITEQLSAMTERMQAVESQLSGHSDNNASGIRTLAIEAGKNLAHEQNAVRQALAAAVKQPSLAAVSLDSIHHGLQSHKHSVEFIESQCAEWQKQR